MKVSWTEKATTDLLSIWEYVARQSPVYADIVSEKLLESPNRLIEHPRSGAIVPEYERDDLREICVYSFRVIYRIVDSEIHILGVIHGARQFPPRDELGI